MSRPGRSGAKSTIRGGRSGASAPPHCGDVAFPDQPEVEGVLVSPVDASLVADRSGDQKVELYALGGSTRAHTTDGAVAKVVDRVGRCSAGPAPLAGLLVGDLTGAA